MEKLHNVELLEFYSVINISVIKRRMQHVARTRKRKNT
jgi:hypothetical protein